MLVYGGEMSDAITEILNSEGDHVDIGYRFLDRVGVRREHILLASAGKNDSGEVQVLSFGLGVVTLWSRKGTVIWEAGIRQVRAIRMVPDLGVEICLSPTLQFNVDRLRWRHHLATDEAKFVENSWLTVPDFLHTGRQLTTLTWREDEYAYLAGRVIVASAACDLEVAVLVDHIGFTSGNAQRSMYGHSGTPLAEALEKLIHVEPTLRGLHQRYKESYDRRNFTVHGIRLKDEHGIPTPTVSKSFRGASKSHAGEIAELRDQDFADLAELAVEIENIGIEASRTCLNFGLAASESP